VVPIHFAPILVNYRGCRLNPFEGA
jgi:hypothetical protein